MVDETHRVGAQRHLSGESLVKLTKCTLATVHFVPLSRFRRPRGTKRTVEVRNVPRPSSTVAGGTKCTRAAAAAPHLPYPAAVDVPAETRGRLSQPQLTFPQRRAAGALSRR